MSSPRVTAVIPTRDRFNVLANAVESVLSQGLRDVEVIVVDDGSQDPVRRETLPGGGTIRIERLNGQGAAAARNHGVKSATAPFVAFLDDDDRWRPDYLESQLAVLGDAAPEVGAVEGGYDLWDAGRPVARYRPNPERDTARVLLEYPLLQPSTVVLRRKAFLETRGFDTSLRRVEDWEYWLRFTDRFQVAVNPRAVVDRACHHPDPGEVAEGYERLLERMRRRWRQFSAEERRRLRAHHELHLAIHLSRVGKRQRARRLLGRSFLRRPRLAPLVQVGRTVVGESTWSRLANLRGRPKVSDLA